jgi:hypothetical protein
MTSFRPSTHLRGQDTRRRKNRWSRKKMKGRIGGKDKNEMMEKRNDNDGRKRRNKRAEMRKEAPP